MKGVVDHITDVLAQARVEGRSLQIGNGIERRPPRPLIGTPKARRHRDPRGVWIRQNRNTTPLALGPLEGRPMHALRLATILANINAKAS